MYGGQHLSEETKKIGDLMTRKPMTEIPINGDHNYNSLKLAKFLIV